MKVTWKGIFDRMAPTYQVEPRRLLLRFLQKAKLLGEGVTVMGYEYESKGDFKKIEILAHPEGQDYIDLRLGVSASFGCTHLWSGINVRLVWDRTSIFSGQRIPTKNRLIAAVKEFNETGKVWTKTDVFVPTPCPVPKPIYRLGFSESPPTQLH